MMPAGLLKNLQFTGLKLIVLACAADKRREQDFHELRRYSSQLHSFVSELRRGPFVRLLTAAGR